jgi:hypothetical protein
MLPQLSPILNPSTLFACLPLLSSHPLVMHLLMRPSLPPPLCLHRLVVVSPLVASASASAFALGCEFQFLVPISGTPILSGIPIPFLIPKIRVGNFYSNPAVEKSRNRDSDSKIWNSKKKRLEFNTPIFAQDINQNRSAGRSYDI